MVEVPRCLDPYNAYVLVIDKPSPVLGSNKFGGTDLSSALGKLGRQDVHCSFHAA
jgi:hypothetical protein